MKKIKKSYLAAFFIVLLLLGLLIGFTTMSTAKNIHLGLDLQGGFEILYEVKPLEKSQKIDGEVLKSAATSLSKRVDALGVSEPNIQIEGSDRIRVQLAGVKDQSAARKMLGTTAHLTFRDINDKLMLDGADLAEGGAGVTFDEMQRAIVTLKLKDADLFGDVTKEIKERPVGENLLVVWLDYEEGDSFGTELAKENSKIVSYPSVSQELRTKDVTIQGDFTIDEANELASMLNAGSLPVELHEIYSTSVSAKFGEKALQSTILAGVVAVILIFIFLIGYYRFPGVIAVISLSVYAYLLLLVYDWMNAVLTLPGIAAFILGIGMAVDANVLTNERIKEEIKTGRSIPSAFKIGSKKSFLTIFDSNFTTIIAGAVLFYFGTSSVKGFALTLIISILISFITAVWGTRLLLGLWIKSNFLHKKPRWFGVKEEDIHEL